MCVRWCFPMYRGMATTSRTRRKDDEKKSKKKGSSGSNDEVAEKLTQLPDPTEESLNDLRTAFGLLDRDSDGHVTLTELQFMLGNLGIQVKDELLHDLMKDASSQGNGLIDEAEFLQWVSKMEALTRNATAASAAGAADTEDEITRDLLAAFRVFDRENNGYITKDDLRRALEMIGEPVTEAQLNQVLALGDIDNNGKIDYEEFVKLLL